MKSPVHLHHDTPFDFVFFMVFSSGLMLQWQEGNGCFLTFEMVSFTNLITYLNQDINVNHFP